MTYKINYLKLDSLEEFSCLEFNKKRDVQSFITGIVYPLKMINEKVYLIRINDEVIVTESGLLVQELFKGKLLQTYPFYYDVVIFIMEYRSYREAYGTALNMKQSSSLFEVCAQCEDGSGWYGNEEINMNCSLCNPNAI